jgi:hypothetical protein
MANPYQRQRPGPARGLPPDDPLLHNPVGNLHTKMRHLVHVVDSAGA